MFSVGEFEVYVGLQCIARLWSQCGVGLLYWYLIEKSSRRQYINFLCRVNFIHVITPRTGHFHFVVNLRGKKTFFVNNYLEIFTHFSPLPFLYNFKSLKVKEACSCWRCAVHNGAEGSPDHLLEQFRGICCFDARPPDEINIFTKCPSYIQCYIFFFLIK